MTDELRAELETIRELTDRASAGPWEPRDVYGLVRPTKIDSYLFPEKHKEAQGQIRRNVEFIAHARNDASRLVAALEAVLLVHEPYEHANRKGAWLMCGGCEENSASEYGTDYPCTTVIAITAALTDVG